MYLDVNIFVIIATIEIIYSIKLALNEIKVLFKMFQADEKE